MPDYIVESWKDLNKVIEKETIIALKNSGNKLKEVLVKKIFTDWYNRPSYNQFGAFTKKYERTYQLPQAVTYKKIKNKTAIDIYIAHNKLKPTNGLYGNFHSYKNLDGATSAFGKSVAEWVTEWIEKGNNTPAMSKAQIYTKTEEEIVGKDLAELTLIGEFKARGIKASKA